VVKKLRIDKKIFELKKLNAKTFLFENLQSYKVRFVRSEVEDFAEPVGNGAKFDANQ